ncbi:MAG: neutral zinc metallopeptidase [Geminicoccaceae bacterium]
MRWQMSRRSQNIEDRRGMGPAGMGRGLRVGGVGGLGLVAFAVIAMLLGVDPSVILGSLTGDGGYSGPQSTTSRGGAPPADDESSQFVAAVLGQTEDVWGQIFQQSGQSYREPTLVLFDGGVQSACGMAGSATGPFYCPADQKVYLDTSFFRELSQKFGAPGDFAAAYVIAHEVGHHVQTLLGISRQVTEMRQRSDERTSNRLSVMMELQADCFAGVWARHLQETQGVLEQGDVEEGLQAASAVGDDRIQHATRGYVVPDAFTHGSSEQRMQWFSQGLKTGDLNSCDTFGAGQL